MMLGLPECSTAISVDTMMDTPENLAETMGAPQRLLLIANRLPITLTKNDPSSEYVFSISSGGLVTGLSGLQKTTKFKWYGWPGKTIPEENVAQVEKSLAEKYDAVPIWVESALMDLHYNKYCNGILWPLFHYHANDMNFEEEPWEAYMEVNKLFAHQIAKDVKDGDTVWIHDYHLMLLPQMLREQLDRDMVKAKIGFFLHTPFPSSSEFCKVPYRDTILEGLLYADLIGFHTYDYARHFLSACHKALRLSTTPNGVKFKNRSVHVGAFPIGIDPEKQIDGVKKDAVMNLVSGRKAKFYEDKSIIVSVDRLDYIKGLPHKFHAFDQFLESNPDKVGKVVLIQIAVPSRQDVQEYQTLCSHISELAGRINAKYGNVDYTPLVYRFCSVPFDELLSLYAMSDVCLITSTRDGMNLVAFEYIACQAKNHGQLVLSEFTGAAQSMKGCIVVNPWDPGDIMEGLKKALEMTPQQKEINWLKMSEYVSKFTSAHWGQSFIEELTRIGAAEAAQEERARTMSTDSDASGQGVHA